MSTSDSPSTAAVKEDNLKKLGILVAQDRPWYEALGMTAERASSILGEDAQDHVSEHGSGLGGNAAERLLPAADEDALKPVCVVFKALFNAIKGAATSRDDLIDLINYGVLIVRSVLETGATSRLSPAAKYALEAFDAEVESVMQLAGSFGVTQQPKAPRRFWRRAQEIGNHININKAIEDHVTQFNLIVGVLRTGAAVQSAEEAKAVLDEIPKLRRVALRTQKAALRTQRTIEAVSVTVALFSVIAAVWFAQIRLQTAPKLAPVPRGVPTSQFGHVVLNGQVDRVCKILGGSGEPAVAALTGRGGAGKTTAAASMVGQRGPIRPRAGETEEQARTHLDRVRALFPDCVVWLRVGRGKGAADRLPSLMLKLAKTLHEDVLEEGIDAPAVGEDGESYVKKIVSQESLQCLVVADDVWEVEVVRKLRKTGMWVLLTTRFPDMVEPNERVVVDKLTETEVENVLRVAAELPPSESLRDAANEVPNSEENNMGAGDLQVALSLFELGGWMWRVRRFKEAEDLFRRALKIEEATLGADDFQLAVTLYTLGMCVQEAGRPGEAEALFKRAQEIEAKLGPEKR